MAKTHNKKRNVGIIYEQLLRKASSSLVEGDRAASDRSLSILRRHFRPGSELYKEFRLFNALVKTTVPHEALAVRILGEARKAAKDHDPRALRGEKSALIKEINHTIGATGFYSQRVSDYRSYATIQMLLNDWRRGSSADLSKVAVYESQVVDWLLSEKSQRVLEEEKEIDVNVLTVKLMTEKFNKKYGAVLNEEQRELIKAYVFSAAEGNKESFTSYLNDLKSTALRELSNYSRQCDNRVLNEKMQEVRQKIESFDGENMCDESLARFLLLSKLRHELMEGDV